MKFILKNKIDGTIKEFENVTRETFSSVIDEWVCLYTSVYYASYKSIQKSLRATYQNEKNLADTYSFIQRNGFLRYNQICLYLI